jgi:hypothetical protein
MPIRSTAAITVIVGALAIMTVPPSARADDTLCKPGHILDESRGLCYDPGTAYRPNVPVQKPIFGSSSDSSAPAPSAPGVAAATPAPSSSGGGIFGWISDQARFCRFGDKQVGKGDAAYCVDKSGKSYPAGK